jgi:hypothetical protein
MRLVKNFLFEIMVIQFKYLTKKRGFWTSEVECSRVTDFRHGWIQRHKSYHLYLCLLVLGYVFLSVGFILGQVTTPRSFKVNISPEKKGSHLQ